jgi:V/A-type H+-transporting ATPase subunit D
MKQVIPTHSAYLELLEERQGMEEGYQFLDEKRLVLAAEMLKELSRFEQAMRRFRQDYGHAAETLQAAVTRHGLEGLEVYPRAELAEQRKEVTTGSVLGVLMLDVRWTLGEPGTPPAVNPSPEAEKCRELFGLLIPKLVALASMTGNLERLREEYQRTARRAKALEEVLLPEIDKTLAELGADLEELEREEAIRVRWSTRAIPLPGAPPPVRSD